MNAEKLERFASIPAEDRTLAENLLFNTPPVSVPDDHPNAEELADGAAGLARAVARAEGRGQSVPIAAIAEHFRGRTGKAKAPEDASCRSISGWRTTSSKARKTV